MCAGNNDDYVDDDVAMEVAATHGESYGQNVVTATIKKEKENCQGKNVIRGCKNNFLRRPFWSAYGLWRRTGKFTFIV